MGFNEFLSSIFGNKSTRDMKEIQPWVEKIKAAYPEVAKLDNDALRAKTEELKAYIHDSAAEQRAKVEELKASVEDTELEKREDLFNQIDKIEKEILEIYEKALDEVLPTAFSIVKETAKRFSENEEIVVTATDFDRQLAATKDFVRIEGDKAIYQNHWIAGGNDTVWNMVHYDVQLFGGVVLHKGKIAEMATGEGKTLVATLPVFLNALTGNGVHVVTVNDYLAKRDSEWMGPLYMFHGLSVDCIDKHQPNSDARRKAYLADITFGTNNEFGFDYLGEPTPFWWPSRSSYFGIVDLAGFPKDAYYMYQSEWTDRTMLHLFPHWNWPEGEPVDVWAYYNNADEGELFLNGKSLGSKKKESGQFHVWWRVPFTPGTIKAVSRKNGRDVLIREIHTAGPAAAIRLTADRNAIEADGKDLSFITVEIIDKNGNLVPDADDLIRFDVQGLFHSRRGQR